MISSIFRSGLVLLALSGGALAAPQKEAFGDWTAGLDEVDTGEDLRKTCSTVTSDVDLTSRILVLGVSIGDGDILPPDAYPTIAVSTLGHELPAGEAIQVTFDAGGRPIVARASSNGQRLVIDNVKETSLPLLRAMAAGRTIRIAIAGKPVPGLSLNGFSAAYRQLGQWCGFPTGDVAK